VKLSGSTHFDTIILGAGGAGMMCAGVAGRRGLNVLLIDHADEPGKKILISGGGRCNFTNLNAPPECFLSNNPHFAKSALARYTPDDFIALVESYKIDWHEKTLGQLFCDQSAKQIVAMLLGECEKGKVTLELGQPISAVDHADGLYRVSYGGKVAEAPQLVVATGGPSIPKMGATGFAYDVARKFGLMIIDPRPALVPLTLGQDEALFRSLSGVSADVVARFGDTEFREAALFTHKGLSGPATLQISSYWKSGAPIAIDFLPEASQGWLLAAKREHPRAFLRPILTQRLPARLAEALSERIALQGELSNIPDRKLEEAERRLSNWRFNPTGSEGFAKAEVTIGGVDTAGLSSQSMEARNMPGLYVIGEAVDVTGWLGGYNFQWAWASGVAAGQALRRES